MIYISQIKQTEKFKTLIDFFENNIIYTTVWDETRVMSVNYGFREYLNPTKYKLLRNCVKEIISFVSIDSRFKSLQEIEIVKYPTGASKKFHFDTTNENTTAASITYLNDDFIGGQTVIDGVSVQPLTGRTVYFDGKEHKHAIMNVIKGNRYTISLWYGYDKRSLITEDYYNGL
jgi:hypothetical protein